MVDTGVVDIRGKQYKTVGLRVTEFRKEYPVRDGWAIRTDLKECTEDSVLFVASIIDPKDHVVATGHAHETWESQINRTSAVENCETSAIGRALANAGFVGSEYASADEVQRAIHQQTLGKSNRPRNGTPPKPTPAAQHILPPPPDWPDTNIHDIKTWIDTLTTAAHFKLAWETLKANKPLVQKLTCWMPVLRHFAIDYKTKAKSVATPELTKKIKAALDDMETDLAAVEQPELDQDSDPSKPTPAELADFERERKAAGAAPVEYF